MALLSVGLVPPCAGREPDWQLPCITIDKALRPGLAPAGARLAAMSHHALNTYRPIGNFFLLAKEQTIVLPPGQARSGEPTFRYLSSCQLCFRRHEAGGKLKPLLNSRVTHPLKFVMNLKKRVW